MFLLYAEDPFLLKEAYFMVSASVPESGREFCFDAFDLKDSDEPLTFEQMLDILNTMPFGAGRRTVIIENIQEALKKDLPALDRYVSSPSDCSLFIMLHKGEPKAHFRDMLKKIKSVSLDIRPQDFPVWVKEKAKKKGFTISDSAIDYLIGVIGPDAGLISSELEKFSLLGKERIETKDIAGLIRGNSDYDAFDLVNALKARDAGKVLKIAKIIQEFQESYSLLGVINWHYTRMYQKERGRADYYTKVFELLNEADYRIKSSGGAFPMEYLLIRLLQL
ncbi:MAG: DNA polymerase III subunit delta [Nitrospirota bacterium]